MAVTHTVPDYLEQLYAFGSVERSAEAERTVTIAYWAQYRELSLSGCTGGGHGSSKQEGNSVDAHTDENVAWFPITALPELAFDHAEIINRGIERLRKRTEQTLVAHRFLAPEFTIAQLRQVTEVVLGKDLDGPNFRRQVLASGEVEETGRMAEGGQHRPAKLYRYRYRDLEG